MYEFNTPGQERRSDDANKNRHPIITVTQTPGTWEERFTVRSYDMDARSNLSIVSLTNFMQDAAGKHAQELGVAVGALLSKNYTWVLSRMALRVDAYPRWGDELVISTWPSAIDKVFAYRDFHLKNTNGSLIGAAVSSWIVIDATTRRPVRVKPFLAMYDYQEQERAMNHRLTKLGAVERFDCEQRFRVRYHDIDLNQHVNNVSYIEWIVESLPPEIHTSSVLDFFEINYLAETRYGEHVIAGCHAVDSGRTAFHHSIIREEDGQEIARAATSWKPL